MKKDILIAVLLLIVLVGVSIYFIQRKPTSVTEITTFEECAAAGNPVMESFPRQCVTAGKTFVEGVSSGVGSSTESMADQEGVTYDNATGDLIHITLPFPGATTGSDFMVRGLARGLWYFEASFPVEVVTGDGTVVAQAVAQAQGDWMTTNFVPFTATMTLPKTFTGSAYLVLKKDNPSGLPEKEAYASFPISVEP